MYALDNSEDGHIEYFHGLKKDKKKAYLKQMKNCIKLMIQVFHLNLRFSNLKWMIQQKLKL